MDVDFSNTDPSVATGSNNAQPMGVLFSDQPNPFANSGRPMEWDFGKVAFGNGVSQ